MTETQRENEARDTELETFSFRLRGEDTALVRSGGTEYRETSRGWEQTPLWLTLPEVLSLLDGRWAEKQSHWTSVTLSAKRCALNLPPPI